MKKKITMGSVFRFGVDMKERGERMAHITVFGIHIFNWIAGAVIRTGLVIRDSVRNCPISEM